MLDQVLQARVDQQAAALMGAIRAAVSGNTGLNQGQTALAVVQVLQNAAAQNQNPGGGSPGNPGQSGSGQTANPGTGSQTTAASSSTGQATASPPPASQTTQAAAQALVNQVKAQTAATMAAAVANATAAFKPAPGNNTAMPGATNTPGTAASGSKQNASTTTGTQPAGTPGSGQAQTATAAPAISGRSTVLTAQALTQLLTQIPNPTPVRVSIPQTGQTVELPQLKALPAGTQITLRQTGQQQVDILKVQLPANQQAAAQQSTSTQPPPAVNVNNQAAQKAALHQTAMTALREALPVQRPVTETIARIQSLLPQLSGSLQSQPNLQQALQTINNATLQVNPQSPPTGEAVRQSLQRSGVFHEAVMMQALQQAAMPQSGPITPVGDDLKGAFFQIFRQLTRSGQQADGSTQKRSTATRGGAEAAADNKQATQQNQLLRSLQEGLARIRSNQLQSSPATRSAEQTAAPGIQTDIPIALNGQLSEVKVKIEQEVWPEDQQPEANESYEKRWVINLSFSPPELGKLHARLFYQHEKLATHIWVEQDDHLPSVSKQLQELKQRLSALGLKIEEVRVQSGVPQQPKNNQVLNLKV